MSGSQEEDGTVILALLRSVLQLQLAERRVEADVAVEHGLAQSDVLALALLASSPGRSIGGLAAELHLSPGSTSTLVHRLEAAGLVDRRPNPMDGRSVLITTTPSGIATVGAVRDRWARALHAATSSLDREGVLATAGVIAGAALHLSGVALRGTDPPPAPRRAAAAEPGIPRTEAAPGP